MSTHRPPLTQAPPAARPARVPHGPLALLALAMALSGLVAAIGLLVDDRTLGGEPIWLKPLKFAVSLGVYGATLAWLHGHLTRGRRAGWWAGTVVAGASAAEMALILVQVVRGQRSHFNQTTPFDAAVYAVMGATVAVLWLGSLVVAVLLFRQPLPDRATTWAIRLGAGISVVGLALGFLMSQPTAEQLGAGATGIIGAHTVGAPDGGPGLPVTGWARTAGDLRVGHFVGMHALQVLPAAAFGLSRVRRLRPETRARLVWVLAGGYAGLVLTVTVQALRGRALVDPDGVTLALAATVAAACACATLAALTRRPGT
ncbi:hypothetical protein ACN20G_19305 [Streptomyces sp. BI20]|uniref:hypothetical protein n=1 Tax=Streptomyces sp. BI20 TaxID=3403460 RepID=UPI003C70768F